MTRREREVCTMMLLGYSSKTMARLLGLAPRTIDEYRQNVLRQFCVPNTVVLVHRLMLDESPDLSYMDP